MSTFHLPPLRSHLVRSGQSRRWCQVFLACQYQKPGWQARLARCTAGLQQFTARHVEGLDVKSSLCIGAGAGALACTGGSGPNGPTGGAGGHGWSGGDGWSGGPGSSSNVLADVAAANDAADGTEEVILLDVEGMKCGGCVGHVKQLLEEQLGVLHATVNLATETALVRVKLAAGEDLDLVAAQLAQVLTNAGFKTTRSKKPAAAAGAAAAAASK